MEIRRQHLENAAQQGLIAPAQIEPLWQFLATEGQGQPSFRASHILYYLGGLIAIGAMSLFMTLGWESFGGWGLCLIALGYGVLGLRLTEYLLGKRHLAIPAGICATFVIVLVPLAVYGLQSGLGYWPDDHAYRDYHALIDWRWLMMELATLAAGAVLLWRYRLPFMVMPIAVTLWYMSMDLAPFLAGGENHTAWELRKFISLWFGLLMILLALWVDIRTRQKEDFAFWLYLFGTLAFWGSLSLMDSGSELGKFLYGCINLAMIAVGALLGRRVFAVFGGLGLAGYVGHLAYHVFKDSLLFPFALTAIGLGVIYLGILWQRHEAAIAHALRRHLPPPLREMLEQRDTP